MSTAVDPIVPAVAPERRPRFNPWAIAMTVTLATFMEVLDTRLICAVTAPAAFLMQKPQKGVKPRGGH